jgi:hypothetical protein
VKVFIKLQWRTRLKILAVFLIVFASFALVFSGDNNLKNFQAVAQIDKVTLTWEYANEANLKGFEVQRGSDKVHFVKLDFVNADGSGKYKYVDDSIFLAKTNDKVYYYRLIITDKSGNFTTSQSLVVSAQISTVRQTWGSIKAMFR